MSGWGGKVDAINGLSGEQQQRAFKSVQLNGLKRRQESSFTLRKSKRDDCILRKRMQTQIGQYNLTQAADSEMTDTTIFSSDHKFNSEEKKSDKPDFDEENDLMKEMKMPRLKVKSGPENLVDRKMADSIFARVKKTISLQPGSPTKDQEYLLRLPELADKINGTDGKMQLEAAHVVRQMLSLHCLAPTQDIINCNFVPRMVYLIRYAAQLDPNKFPGVNELQVECLWSLSTVTSTISAYVYHCMENDVLKACIDGLKSPSELVRSQAMWAVSNIAADNYMTRDIVIDQTNILDLVIQFFPSSKNRDTLQNIAWFCHVVCRRLSKREPRWSRISLLIPILSQLLRSSDTEVLKDVCVAFGILTSDETHDSEKIDAVIRFAICPRLVELISSSENVVVQKEALRVMGNIVASTNPDHTKAAVQANFVAALFRTVQHTVPRIRTDSFWAVSNIAADESILGSVLDARIVGPMILILNDSRSGESNCRKEAMWALYQMVFGASTTQLQYLVRQGAIPAVCANLMTYNIDILTRALETVDIILGHDDVVTTTTHGGKEKTFRERVEAENVIPLLETYSVSHENDSIAKKSAKILSTYFPTSDD